MKQDIRHLVLDYNGTLALDGALTPGVKENVARLAETFTVHVLTADTRGDCAKRVAGMPVRVHVLETKPEDEAKLAYVNSLGAASCVAVGNGRNDGLMLEAAAVGVAIIGGEGASTLAVKAADVVVKRHRISLRTAAQSSAPQGHAADLRLQGG